jgi:hypothetical protein
MRKIIGILIVILMIGASFSATSDTNSDVLVLIRIDTTETYPGLPQDAIIVGQSFNWVDIVIEESKLSEITSSYELLIYDVEAYDDSVRGVYHTLAEVYQILSDTASNYPSITKLTNIGTSYEGRQVKCLEISDNPGVDQGEPGVFFMGLHHAREWPTVEICLYIIDQLTSEYGYDSTITDLVNNRRIWIVTVVNPDGYYYCHDQGHDWRKNRHYFPEWGTYGVDLNRNYPGSCNGNIDGAWGSVGTGSISHYPTSEVFCGPGPFSELETQFIRDMFIDNDISATISYHTHGELVLWPWNWATETTPDNSYLSQVGQDIAAEITQQDGTGTYSPSQGVGLYPTTGDTTDWAYGYSHYVLGRTTFAFTLEACTSFHPSESYLDQVVMENFDGALYLLEEAEDIRDTTHPRVLPPTINELTEEPDYYVVSWTEQNPDANPSKFRLDELTDLTIVEDDGESGSDLWTLNGFTLTTEKSYSSSHSYKAHDSNSETSSLTTEYPVPINSGDKLSFYCWYDIENNYDMAMIEVSTHGRYYEILDTFTSSSSGWEYKEYNLDDYAGESIYIRFRYATDGGTLEDGFFVDDISPVADFQTVETLSNTINSNHYTISNQPPGEYYYQVKGYNSARGWGDFSTLENVTVIEGENFPPNEPSNPNPIKGQLNVQIDADISWTGGDPNPGDVVYYDVYFGTDSSPDSGELVSEDQTETTYDLEELEYDTKYYWQIIATDDEGETTEGPIWYFTTIEEPNFPPNEPSNPEPEDNAENIAIDTVLTWTGGDPNEEDTVTYDVYFGTIEDPGLVSEDQTATSYNPGILGYETHCYWKIITEDEYGETTEGPIWSFTTIDKPNSPPEITITGPTNGKTGTPHDFTFTVSDQDEDDYYLWIDWCDGNIENWIGPYEYGEEKIMSHTWTKQGDYIIKAKARDIYGAESDWATLEVSMPKAKTFDLQMLFHQFLENHPYMFPLLRQLLGL